MVGSCNSYPEGTTAPQRQLRKRATYLINELINGHLVCQAATGFAGSAKKDIVEALMDFFFALIGFVLESFGLKA